MNGLKSTLINNKKLMWVVVAVFAVFMNCFGLPLYNFEKDFGLFIKIINILICLEGFFYIGVMFNYALREVKSSKVILLTLVYTFLGMICRYLLEFGEISNEYNFTAENIAFHTLMSLVVTYLGWFWYRRKSEK